MQTFTSKNTSINIKKLPKVFNHINYETLKDTIIVDYGCGKYTHHIRQKIEREGLKYLPFDPYWEPYRVIHNISSRFPSIFVCSNVLNVIDNELIISHICKEAQKDKYAGYIFSIYEGDKSGIGKETKKDCYQRNEKLSEYLKFFGHNAIIYKGFITNNRNLIK